MPRLTPILNIPHTPTPITTQMTLSVDNNNKPPTPLLSLHLHQSLMTPHIDVLKAKVEHYYEPGFEPQPFLSHKEATRINIRGEAVCVMMCPFEDRIWAKRFCSNQQLHSGFKLYIVTSSEEQSERAQKYNSRSIKVVLFPADIDSVSKQICMMTQVYSLNSHIGHSGNEPLEYFCRARPSRALCIYVSEELVTAFRSQGKKILRSRHNGSVQIRNFSSAEELVAKCLSDTSNRRKTQIRVDQLVFEEGTNLKMSPQERLSLFKAMEAETRNLILIDKHNPHIDILREFITNDKYRRWEMVIVDDGNLLSHRVANPLADDPLPRQPLPHLNKMVSCGQLLVIIHRSDSETKSQFNTHDRIQSSNALVQFGSERELGDILTRLQLSHHSYGLLMVSEEVYTKYRAVIRGYIDSPFPIINLKILINQNAFNTGSFAIDPSSILLGQEPSEEEDKLVSPCVFEDLNMSLLQKVMVQRESYLHPASGLEGRKIVLLVHQGQYELIELANAISGRNPQRIIVDYCQDFQHIQYVLSQLRESEWGVVIVEEKAINPVLRILNSRSQLIVVANGSSKYAHHKILKDGTHNDILEFFSLIPGEEPSRVSNTYAHSMYTDCELTSQTFKRFDFEDSSVMPFDVTTSNSEVTVRLPLHLEEENTSILEANLIHTLKTNVRVKYYSTTAEIRDMGSKWEEKTQYLVITDDYLPWTQEFAKNELHQRFEILLYTVESSETHRQLTAKGCFMRFKLVTNRWSEIEAYILRSHQILLEPHQRLQIVLGKSDGALERAFDRSPIISQIYFRYYDQMVQDSIKSVVKGLNSQHLIVVVINENRGKLCSEGKVIQDIERVKPSARTLLVSEKRQSKYPRTLVSMSSLEKAGCWLSAIKVQSQGPSRRVSVTKLK